MKCRKSATTAEAAPHPRKLVCVVQARVGDAIMQRQLQPLLALLQLRTIEVQRVTLCIMPISRYYLTLVAAAAQAQSTSGGHPGCSPPALPPRCWRPACWPGTAALLPDECSQPPGSMGGIGGGEVASSEKPGSDGGGSGGGEMWLLSTGCAPADGRDHATHLCRALPLSCAAHCAAIE